MKTIVEEIITSRNPGSADEAKAILREIIQSTVLVGLSRSSFFEKASFYGGTALRIFHHLNRYSEDLDFTLNETNTDFSLDPYLIPVKEIAASYGFDLEIGVKNKKVKTPIESAFAKLNTYQTFLRFHREEPVLRYLHKDEVLKVKIEVDCQPSIGFKTERKWLDLPEFAPVIVLDEASLFSGKLHVLLCRNYKNTVKGRDYFDFLFYVQNGVKPNLAYLKNKLIQTGKIKESDPFDLSILKDLLKTQFEKVDFDQVKKEAMRFVFHNEDLSFYTKELFLQMVDRI